MLAECPTALVLASRTACNNCLDARNLKMQPCIIINRAHNRLIAWLAFPKNEGLCRSKGCVRWDGSCHRCTLSKRSARRCVQYDHDTVQATGTVISDSPFLSLTLQQVPRLEVAVAATSATTQTPRGFIKQTPACHGASVPWSIDCAACSNPKRLISL